MLIPSTTIIYLSQENLTKEKKFYTVILDKNTFYVKYLGAT
jgi:hypothetical protein